MSGIRPPGLVYTNLASKWGWFIVLGLAFILAGALAVVDTIAVTLISVIFIGAMMLSAGIIHLVHAFFTKGWNSFLFNVACGALYVIGGFLIMREPVEGSMVITLLVAIVLVGSGVLRIAIAVRHRELQGWWTLVLGGLVSAVVGVTLMVSLPWAGLWVLGTLIAIELVVQGVMWFRFGLTLRHMAHAPA